MDHFIKVKEARSQVEAEVKALRESVQFCLQESGVTKHELSVIIGSSVIMEWLKNENLLNWDIRFERNLFLNIKVWLKDMSVCHVLHSKNPWCAYWKSMVDSQIQNLL